MACGGLESPICRDTIARFAVGTEVEVTDAPSLEVAFGVAVAAGSDLSRMLTAQESALLLLYLLYMEHEIRLLAHIKQSSLLYLTSKAILFLHIFGAICHRRGPGRH